MNGFSSLTPQHNFSLNLKPIMSDEFHLAIEIINVNFVVQREEQNSTSYMPYEHKHSFFEIHMPLIGFQTYLADQKQELPIYRGSALLLCPHTQHVSVVASQDLKKLVISFRLKADELSAQSHDLHQIHQALSNQHFLLSNLPEACVLLAFQLVEDSYHGEPLQSYLTQALLTQILIQFIRKTDFEQMNAEDTADQKQERTRSIERFIHDNIASNITAKMVSEHMYLSTRQIDRIVLDVRGITLKELIIRIKLDEARRMLLNTELTQKEMAKHLGFSEESSFIRFFTNLEGISPGQFRKQSKTTVVQADDR